MKTKIRVEDGELFLFSRKKRAIFVNKKLLYILNPGRTSEISSVFYNGKKWLMGRSRFLFILETKGAIVVEYENSPLEQQ